MLPLSPLGTAIGGKQATFPVARLSPLHMDKISHDGSSTGAHANIDLWIMLRCFKLPG